MPIELSVNVLPFGAITLAPALTQRLARGMSAVTTTSPGQGPLGDPVVGDIRAARHHDPLDECIARHHDDAVRHDVDVAAVPLGHPIDLLFDRASVGVDIDRDAAWLRHA